jgi:hypothetical protein
MIEGAAFYCVSSGEYFPGAVGLINSLRLAGHTEPILLLDCGLNDRQREAVAAEVTVVPAPTGTEPFRLKPHLPLSRPAEVIVLVDTDVVVTRSLAPLIDRAATGAVVAFRDHAERFVPEWGELLGLGELRPSPYLCSGVVAVGREPGVGVLKDVDERDAIIDYERSYFGRHDDAYPLLYADQDVLNAVVAGRVAPERVVALEHKLAPMPPFAGLRLIDATELRCAFEDGTEPYVVHHSLSPKPWMERTPDGVYTALLRRLILGADVPVRLPASEVPPPLRRGERLGGLRRRLGASRIPWAGTR